MAAVATKNMGEYEEAITLFQEYKQKVPNDARAEKQIEAAKRGVAAIEKSSNYQVNNMKDLNAKESDFGVTYSGRPGTFDEIIFISGREGVTGKDEDGWTNQGFFDLFTSSAERKTAKKKVKGKASEAEEVRWSVPVPLSAEVLNNEHHQGPGTFDKRRKTLYYTDCPREKNAKLGCKLMMTERQGQGWTAPEHVIVGGDTSMHIGHPSLAMDDKVLFFVSDREGGKGGKDIWMAEFDRRSRSFGTPKNLGSKVNTSDDELFPFVHDDGYLYFSSNGHAGFGGLDIFRIKLNEQGMPEGELEDMPYPINTYSDDFGIIFEAGGAKKGFVCSDRTGGVGADDIYSVYLVPNFIKIEGVVTNTKRGTPVSQATVRLDGSDGTSIVVNTDNAGKYEIPKENLKENVNYRLTYEKTKFLNTFSDATTVGIPQQAFEYVKDGNYFLHTLRMNKTMDPIEEPIVLPNVLFDLAKWDLRPESMVALDSVVSILKDNPTIVIELRSHTDYRDNNTANQELSQKRAQSCVDYLISKGISADRLVAKGMGESEPFVVPEGYKGLGADLFKAGDQLSEAFITRLSANAQEIANQINRRTDFKVLRDDYTPSTAGATPEAGAAVAAGGAAAAATPAAETKPVGQFYVCGPKDNFGKIAKDNGITIVQLKDLNGGLRGVRPFEGLELKITPNGDYADWDASHYRVEAGEVSLKKIASKLGVDYKELKDLNEGIKDTDLVPGFVIKTK
jgi:peptidoglycan-associated lipoprotein